MIKSPWVWIHEKLTTGVHGVGPSHVALAPTTSHLVRTFTKGWTANKVLKGAGVNSNPTELNGLVLNYITPFVGYSVTGVSSSPRTATVSSVSGTTITLTANEAYRFRALPSAWTGDTYLKIANTTRAEYAWVSAVPAVNQLTVTVAADIAAWVNGNTISTAYDGASSVYSEVDLSPETDIPDGAVAIYLRLYPMDTGTIAQYKGTDVRGNIGGTGFTLWCYPQASGISVLTYGFCTIDSNKHLLVRDRATGTDTLQSSFEVAGYLI